VLGQEINGARVVTLNRPRQLNGISDRVVRLFFSSFPEFFGS
jgi:3-hydroxyisobutyryl-CoA hydrolase